MQPVHDLVHLTQIEVSLQGCQNDQYRFWWIILTAFEK